MQPPARFSTSIAAALCCEIKHHILAALHLKCAALTFNHVLPRLLVPGRLPHQPTPANPRQPLQVQRGEAFEAVSFTAVDGYARAKHTDQLQQCRLHSSINRTLVRHQCTLS
jgi:hypothetical protein